MPADRERYQTVYAGQSGSVAAPTAGLHFTTSLLEELRARGVEQTAITLHVGYGTFKPVRVERVDEHEVDPEIYTVSASTADALTRALEDGRRIIAVGTTTTRALESLTLDAFGVCVLRQVAPRCSFIPAIAFASSRASSRISTCRARRC